MAEFEWDEDKRLSNLEKHGVDLLEGHRLFDGRPVSSQISNHQEEVRILTTGIVNGRYFTLVWTQRDHRCRLISLRRARKNEEQAHRSTHS